MAQALPWLPALICLGWIVAVMVTFRPSHFEARTIESYVKTWPKLKPGVLKASKIPELRPVLGYAAWERMQELGEKGFPFDIHYDTASKLIKFRVSTKSTGQRKNLFMELAASPAPQIKRVQYTAGCNNQTTVHEGTRRFLEYQTTRFSDAATSSTKLLGEEQVVSMANAVICAGSKHSECHADCWQAQAPHLCLQYNYDGASSGEPRRTVRGSELLEGDLAAQIIAASVNDRSLLTKYLDLPNNDTKTHHEVQDYQLVEKQVVTTNKMNFRRTFVAWIELVGAFVMLLTLFLTLKDAMEAIWLSRKLHAEKNHVTALDVLCSPFTAVSIDDCMDWEFGTGSRVSILGHEFELDEGWMLVHTRGICLVDNTALRAVQQDGTIPRFCDPVLPFSVTIVGVPIEKMNAMADLCNEWNLCITSFLSDFSDTPNSEMPIQVRDALWAGKVYSRETVPRFVSRKVARPAQLGVALGLWLTCWLLSLVWRRVLFFMPLLNQCIIEAGWQHWSMPIFDREKRALRQALDVGDWARPLLLADLTATLLEISGWGLGHVYCMTVAAWGGLELAWQAGLQPVAKDGELTVAYWGRFAWGGCVESVPHTRCGIRFGSLQLWFNPYSTRGVQKGLYAWHVEENESNEEFVDGPAILCGSM